MSQKYVFPEKYQVKIEGYLNTIGFSLFEPKKIAQLVLNLSTHYQNSSSTTPWDNNNTAAYLSYFFPLNYLRNLKVYSQLPKDFISNTNSFLDFGCGPGTATLALSDLHQLPCEGTAIETSREAFSLYERLKDKQQPRLHLEKTLNNSKTQLGIFSYSLNELLESPKWLFNLEKILILEPSTKNHGRKLMVLRQKLIDLGFYIWAPCTHQSHCPLLAHSKNDWCHDRLHWQMPDWFKSIEAQLPMKNHTLTLSYLVASKKLPPITTANGRIVGDPLKEKGKIRWLFCQNDEREFLSWLKKNGEAPNWQRGDLVNFESLEKRGNEIRFK